MDDHRRGRALPAGVYRLQFWVTLQTTPQATGHATFPLFQVA